jgi:hypothetical protein
LILDKYHEDVLGYLQEEFGSLLTVIPTSGSTHLDPSRKSSYTKLPVNLVGGTLFDDDHKLD